MPDWIDPTVKLFPLLISVATAIFAWVVTRRRDVDQGIAENKAQLEKLRTRIVAAEQKIAEAPGREDIHDMKLQLTEMAGNLKVMSTSFDGYVAILTRMEARQERYEDHLLEAEKGS